MKKWINVDVLDLKPGDRVRYKFSDFDPWYDAVVVRLGDVTVKTSVGSICQKAHFQRRQEPPSQWQNVAWDGIKKGDMVKVYAGPELKVDTIGDRYFKAVEEYDLRCRYLSDIPLKENRWQRLEEAPLTDTEKLEKLVEMSSLYFKQKEYDAHFTDFLKTQEELKALIKEYSK